MALEEVRQAQYTTAGEPFVDSIPVLRVGSNLPWASRAPFLGRRSLFDPGNRPVETCTSVAVAAAVHTAGTSSVVAAAVAADSRGMLHSTAAVDTRSHRASFAAGIQEEPSAEEPASAKGLPPWGSVART